MAKTQTIPQKVDFCIQTLNAGNERSKTALSMLIGDILDSEITTFDELELKSRMIERLFNNQDRLDTPFDCEKILRGLVHDIMHAYAHEKSKFDGSFGKDAPQSYLNLFYPAPGAKSR